MSSELCQRDMKAQLEPCNVKTHIIFIACTTRKRIALLFPSAFIKFLALWLFNIVFRYVRRDLGSNNISVLQNQSFFMLDMLEEL